MTIMWRAILFFACLTSIGFAQVPPGTPIRLVLLRDISSGSSMLGDLVPLLVAEDVEVDGQVTITEGTMAFAKITQCRREGALSATVFDKPARLAVKFEHLRDVNGREVKLQPKPGKDGDLQITRELTVHSNRGESKDIESAWQNPQARPVMEKVQRLFSDAATSITKKEAEVLISHNVQLPIVQEAIRTGVFDRVTGFIRDIKRGRTIEAFLSITPTTRPALLAIRAVRELGRLSGGIGNYIGGRFKGRNIRCSAGVELTVYSG
jgi:hypothetical protein